MRIRIEKGDITSYATDIIVNAANSGLMGGGGVDGAIHKAGGIEILNECIKIRERQGGCRTGEAVYTTAGALQAKYVIHTVGPVWNLGNQEEKNLLKDCYLNSLKLAKKLGCSTIAFPNISTGVYKFPKDIAADLVAELFIDSEFLLDYDDTFEVVFVNFDEENYRIYLEKFNGLLFA